MGRFEMADGGTLFLDEIGDMNRNLQVKLLRVLQERSFEPVGSAKTVYTNVRVIAATNVDLEAAVAEGRFREDLFYRLNVIPIHIPSLRERPADIPLLLHHFMESFNRSRNRQLKAIAPDAMGLLMNYAWPGNIREILENLVERLAILKGAGTVRSRRSTGKISQRNSRNRPCPRRHSGKRRRLQFRGRRLRERADHARSRKNRLEPQSGRASAPPEPHNPC